MEEECQIVYRIRPDVAKTLTEDDLRLIQNEWDDFVSLVKRIIDERRAEQ